MARQSAAADLVLIVVCHFSSACRCLALKCALEHPAWGHRKVWAMVRHDGHVVSEATVLRLLRDEGLILPAHYQRERRKLAERRNAAFAAEPTGPNRVWQLDFSEFETTAGGTWWLAGCRDYWSKCEVDPDTGEPLPVVTIVTDNGGPFRSFRFEAFITAHPELAHVRTRVKSPGHNRVTRARVRHAEIRAALHRRNRRRTHPRQARRGLPARVQPDPPSRSHRLEPTREVHLGLADPTAPTFQTKKILPTP
nr:IS3 family transposase [Fodinicola acaciae]